MTNKSSRKNYDDIPAELTLREKVRTVRERALKLKAKSPDITKMIRVEVPALRTTFFVSDDKGIERVKNRLKKNFPFHNLEIKVNYPKC